MANKQSAEETSSPKSKTRSYTGITATSKQPQLNNNVVAPRKFKEGSETKKMGEHPSLAPSANVSSGSSSRFNSGVGHSMTSTITFCGNPYLSNQNSKLTQNAQVLIQYAKNTIPQARQDQSLSQQSFMPMKSTSLGQSNLASVSSQDSKIKKTKGNATDESLATSNCDQNGKNLTHTTTTSPLESRKQKEQVGGALNHFPPTKVVSSEGSFLDKPNQPRVVSAGNVDGMVTSKSGATSKGTKIVTPAYENKIFLPKKTDDKYTPVVVPSSNTNPFLYTVNFNTLEKKTQISEPNSNHLIKTTDKGNEIPNTNERNDVHIAKKDMMSNPTSKPINNERLPAQQMIIGHTNNTVPEKTLTEGEQNRLKLANAYGPYLIPSDMSLSAARNRLRKALKQTRDLRVSFSDRVYNKYRILLRPVPKTVDDIIEPIKQNPKEAKLKIEQKIKLIREEKDAEKKEIPKRAAVISNSLLSGEQIFGVSSSASAMNIAESEQLFSAGLSLVILPEEDIDESDINVDEYEHRGPTDPETGQRLGGISIAAAAAAEALLDRTRRGVASRMERRRRNILSEMETKIGTSTTDNVNSSVKQGSSDVLRKSELSVEKALGLPQSFGKSKPGKLSQVVSPKLNSKRQPFTKSSGSSNSSTWNHKRRVSKSLAVGNVNSLLSISPHIEGKNKAAALAIHSLSPGFTGSSGRSSNLHSFRAKQNQHPHPESKGGIAQMTLGNSSRKSAMVPFNSKSLCLPRVVKTYKRKRTYEQTKNILSVDNVLKTESIEAIGHILSQFYTQPSSSTSNNKNENLTNETDLKTSSDGESNGEMKPLSSKKRKRRVTELGMLRGLRNFESISSDLNSNRAGGTDSANCKLRKLDKDVDPILAFSILHALGIVGVARTQNFDLETPVQDGSVTEEDLKIVKFMNTDEKVEFTSKPLTDITLSRWYRLRKDMQTIHCHSKKHENDIHERKNETIELKKSSVSLDTKKNMKKNADKKNQMYNSQDSIIEKQALDIKNDFVAQQKLQKANTDIAEGAKSKSADNEKKKHATAQSKPHKAKQEKKNAQQPRSWDALATRRGDLSHHPQQQLGSQHHTPPQFLSHMQAPAMQHNYSVLSQAGNVSNAFTSSPQRPNRLGLNPIDQHLNHSNAHLHHRSAHLNQVSYGEALKRNTKSSVHHSDFFHGSSHLHHPQQNRPYGSAASDWSSLGLLSGSPTMMGGIDLSASQAHAMIGHSAQALMVREQQRHHFAAAVRTNLNNIASLSAQQANLLLSNGGVPNGTAFQQQRLQQYGGHAQVQAGGDISMMASAGLLMTGQRTVGESFPSLNPSQSQSLMYLAAAKESPVQFMKRPSSAGAPSNSIQLPASFVRPASAEQFFTKKQNSKLLEKKESSERALNQTKSAAVPTGTGAPPSKCQSIQKKIKEVPPKVPQKSGESKLNKLQTSQKLDGVSKSSLNHFSTQKSNISSQSALPEKTAMTGGMQLYIPPTPSGLSEDAAKLIKQGVIHKLGEGEDKNKALEYLISLGTAIPIPKALISNPLKERLAMYSKASGNACSFLPKDVAAAAITTWLWSEHCDCFQRAFAKSGRIDVDPECKWLINLAIDTSLRVILFETITKAKGSGRDVKYEFRVASTICKSLMREIHIDEKINIACTNFKSLLCLLDERRLQALKLLCQERVLIATLISRHVKMTEQFANSYVSAMIRAGEALGHEDLCDIVQDEITGSCTLLPHDILSDSTGKWDDPCRATSGFSANLNASQLTMRAHSRAQLHKSLFKLQDKFDIKGGVSGMGPYSESESGGDGTSSVNARAHSPVPSKGSGANILRRRSSASDSGKTYSSTNYNSALSSRFNPLHYSLPLLWDPLAIENMPYGRHVNGVKKTKRMAGSQGNSKIKKPRLTNNTKENGRTISKVRSTEAVDWSDVSKFFQPVTVHKSSTPAKKKHPTSNSDGINIFAPVFREIKADPEEPSVGWSDSDNSDDEDISKEAVLARHQVVLDSMRQKIDVALEAKQKNRKKA